MPFRSGARGAPPASWFASTAFGRLQRRRSNSRSKGCPARMVEQLVGTLRWPRFPSVHSIPYQLKVFLTITAPNDAAAVGTSFPLFELSARCSYAPRRKVLEHSSIPLTLYYTTDTGFFRASPLSRAAVAKPQGPWLEAVTNEIAIVRGKVRGPSPRQSPRREGPQGNADRCEPGFRRRRLQSVYAAKPAHQGAAWSRVPLKARS